mmetsp:Transcript_147799/g.375570  ORF Transcript_147799/g.375570 Transcript_147799/m.375570 type:complete len:224 (+) Transcript_147799:473-1144(+)
MAGELGPLPPFIIASGTNRIKSPSSRSGISVAGGEAPQAPQRQRSASGTPCCAGLALAISGYSGRQHASSPHLGQRIRRDKSGPRQRAHWQMNHNDDNLRRRSMVLVNKFMPLPIYEKVKSSPGVMGRIAWYCSRPSGLNDQEQLGAQLCENLEPKTKIPAKPACFESSSSLWMLRSTMCRKRSNSKASSRPCKLLQPAMMSPQAFKLVCTCLLSGSAIDGCA